MSENQPFELVTSYQPAGDQPQAIEKLVNGIEQGLRNQLLLGVTGSGKTYTMANVIAQTQRPTIVMAHNKTLAAQLYGEFKAFFPNNAVEYFVSYYDYYQPEAYVPSSDTFIEKDSAYNTPPVFCIYTLNKMLHWIIKQGGLDIIEKRNNK